MATKQWLTFEYQGLSASGKTKLWLVYSVHDKSLLGNIFWYGPWRQYCFSANILSIWNSDCLKELSMFIADENRLHKNA